MFGGGMGGEETEFGTMLQQAAKMKGAMMAKEKVKFAKWPVYLQHTMYHKDELAAHRSLPTRERIDKCRGIKDESNGLFKAGRYGEAEELYERALGILKYVHNVNDNWKKEGIKDEEVSVVDWKPTDDVAVEDAADEVKALKLSLYLNVAATQIKERNWTMARQACDDALVLDAKCSKALYRRAMAWDATGASTEFQMGLKDMNRAYKIDPTDKNIRRELSRMRKIAADLKGKDKEFGGMFERGDVYTAADHKAIQEAVKEVKPADESSRRYESMIEVENDLGELRTRIRKAEDAGDHAEAKEMRERLTGVEKIIGDAKEKAKKKAKAKALAERPDFTKPSDDMIADAKKSGLDLLDPVVQKEFMRLQQAQAEGKDITKEFEKMEADEGLAAELQAGQKKRWSMGWKIAVGAGIWIAFRLCLMYWNAMKAPAGLVPGGDGAASAADSATRAAGGADDDDMYGFDEDVAHDGL